MQYFVLQEQLDFASNAQKTTFNEEKCGKPAESSGGWSQNNQHPNAYSS